MCFFPVFSRRWGSVDRRPGVHVPSETARPGAPEGRGTQLVVPAESHPSAVAAHRRKIQPARWDVAHAGRVYLCVIWTCDACCRIPWEVGVRRSAGGSRELLRLRRRDCGAGGDVERVCSDAQRYTTHTAEGTQTSWITHVCVCVCDGVNVVCLCLGWRVCLSACFSAGSVLKSFSAGDKHTNSCELHSALVIFEPLSRDTQIIPVFTVNLSLSQEFLVQSQRDASPVAVSWRRALPPAG